MANLLIEHLPTSYQSIHEIKHIFSALQQEFELLSEEFEQSKKNLFIDTCDDLMLDKYGKILNISGETEEKRTNIKISLGKIPPFNIDSIKNYLTMYVKDCDIIINDNLTIDINYKTGGREIDPLGVINNLYTLIPANMFVNFRYTYATYSDIEGEIWSNIDGKTWHSIIY